MEVIWNVDTQRSAVRSIAWLGLIVSQRVIGKCLLQKWKEPPSEKSVTKPLSSLRELDLSTVRAHQHLDGMGR
jgi:hypothetical protein